uniref:Tape measure protein n=2 Tax=unclassified bacterial viruses TaxID=12333 RepID=A0AAU6VY13_9VIRU
MFQQEIARLTGKLVFQVDNRPLATFEKKLGGVLTMLRELSTLANKKFTVKVSLDSRSLRAQIEKATKTKISLTNVDISNEALLLQGKKIQEYLNRTTINLTNVRIDVAKLVEQKRFVKTLMGQMSLALPVTLQLSGMEAQLRKDLKVISERNPLKISVQLSNNNLAMKLRRAMIEAQKKMGELKIRVADPQVRLKVDKQHLIDEIRAAIASSEFKIRIGARRDAGSGDFGERARGHGRSQADRGLSAAMGFARGALPGLGAAFAFSQMNDISQKVIAATNSLEAVSGGEEKFNSNKNFLNNLANEQGLNFRDMAPQYSSIYQAAAPSIGISGVQDMFRGITQFGTTHGISKEAMKGSMVALGQMFGKDKIQAEEARQQFAERMPGGMALLAKAAGNAKQTKNGTVAEFSELMQSGKADPKKILPELGRLMKEASEHNNAYAKSLETTRVAQGRMNKSFEDSVMVFSAGGFDKGMGGFFNNLADQMRRAEPLVRALGGAFEILVKPLNALVRIFGFIGQHWDEFAKKLGVSSQALATFAAAVAIFMLPFGGFITAIGFAALALDDLLTYFNGGDSVFGQMVKDIPGASEQIDAISQSWDHLVNSISEVGLSFDGLKTKTKDVFGNVEVENPFVTMLRTISEYVDNIASGLDRIAAVLRGDFQSGFKGLGDAYKQKVIEQLPGYKIAKYVTGEGMDQAGQFLNGFRTHETMPVPSPLNQPTNVPAMVAPNITIPSITLMVKAPEGVSDAKSFAVEMAPHIQELTYNAIQSAFGAARAQQAERQ